jgi:hypothetical protein
VGQTIVFCGLPAAEQPPNGAVSGEAALSVCEGIVAAAEADRKTNKQSSRQRNLPVYTESVEMKISR